MRLLSPACRTARLLHAGRPVSSIDASSASKASALVRRSLAVVKHIPPIVFSIVYTFRTPSVKHDAVVVSACRTARFLHAGRPVTRSASFHDIRRREIAPADYPRRLPALRFISACPACPSAIGCYAASPFGWLRVSCMPDGPSRMPDGPPLGRRCAAGCWAQQQVVFLR